MLHVHVIQNCCQLILYTCKCKCTCTYVSQCKYNNVIMYVKFHVCQISCMSNFMLDLTCTATYCTHEHV